MAAPFIVPALIATVAAIAFFMRGRKGQAPPGLTYPQPPAQGPAAALPQGPYIDVTRDGVQVFKPPVAATILDGLNQMAVVPVGPDLAWVQIIVRTDPNVATAREWAASMNTQRSILATVDFLAATPTPRQLRAVPAGTEREHATIGSPYGILALPQTIPAMPPRPGAGPAGPLVTPGPACPEAFNELPRELRDDACRALTQGQDPVALDRVAVELDRAGYSRSAALLRERAQQLRVQRKIQAIQSGHVIQLRANDNPSYLAEWYTGDGARFKELLTTNPELRLATMPHARTGQPMTVLLPWRVGQTLILPPSWDTSRGPAPPMGGGMPVPGPVAPPPVAPTVTTTDTLERPTPPFVPPYVPGAGPQTEPLPAPAEPGGGGMTDAELSQLAQNVVDTTASVLRPSAEALAPIFDPLGTFGSMLGGPTPEILIQSAGHHDPWRTR
jgi:hypothetical protein